MSKKYQPTSARAIAIQRAVVLPALTIMWLLSALAIAVSA